MRRKKRPHPRHRHRRVGFVRNEIGQYVLKACNLLWLLWKLILDHSKVGQSILDSGVTTCEGQAAAETEIRSVIRSVHGLVFHIFFLIDALVLRINRVGAGLEKALSLARATTTEIKKIDAKCICTRIPEKFSVQKSSWPIPVLMIVIKI